MENRVREGVEAAHTVRFPRNCGVFDDLLDSTLPRDVAKVHCASVHSCVSSMAETSDC